jgi:hypothetical protein
MMKNAKQFTEINNILTNQDRAYLTDALEQVFENHSDTEWSELFGAVVRYVIHKLNCRLAEDSFDESFGFRKEHNNGV